MTRGERMGEAQKPEAADSTYALRADVVEWLDVEDEVVALDSRRSIYLSLNGTGAVLWRVLAGGATLGQLVSSLVDDYDVAAERADTDVRDFLETLREHDLLTVE